MKFTITAVTRCPGGGHYHVEFTAEGKSRTVTVTHAEIVNARQDVDTLRERAIDRILAAIHEANATTLAQARNALVGKEFSA